MNGSVSLPWILAAMGAALAPHAMHLPLWVTLWCLLLWGYVLAAPRKNWPSPGQAIRLGLVFIGFGAVLIGFGTPFGGEGFIALLAVLCGLKPFEVNGYRDAVVTLFLAYFLVIAGILHTESMPMAVWMAGSVWLTTAVLIRHNQKTVSPGAPLRLSAKLMAQAAPLMVAFFFLFPRLPGGLWGLNVKGAAVTGLSDTVSPGTVAELVRSLEPAFRVDFQGPIPPRQSLYWRAIVLGVFDGTAWVRDVERNGIPPSWPKASRLSEDGEVVDYAVILEAHGRKWIFALDLPVSVPYGTHLAGDYTLSTLQPVNRRIGYRLKSRTGGHTGEILLLKAERDAALALPADAGPGATALARKWASEAQGDEEIVGRALRFFRQEPFFYTLKPALLEGDPVDDFLFRTRKGFCEHFASAFAFLMRAAGIPCRLVAGYLGGEVNPYGGYLTVRQADAHVWAEVYLKDRGWTRVDPTTAVAPERIERSMEALFSAEELEGVFDLGQMRFLSGYFKPVHLAWDAMNTGWQRWVIGYTVERQRRLLSGLGIRMEAWIGPAKLILILAAGSAAFGFLFLYLRNRRPESPSDAVQAAYLRFCRKLVGAGLPARQSHQGPLDYADAVCRQRKDLEKAIQEITGLYVSLRYGREENAEFLRQFTRRVRAFHPHKHDRI